MRCHCRNGLSVIQGDTLEVTVDIDNPEDITIEKVEFVCKSLGLREELSLLEEGDINWGFTIEAERTKNFRVGTFYFDVNATLDSGDVFTVVYDKPIQVIYKYNK